VRRALLLISAAIATAAAGCGEDSPESTQVKGDTLTVYASLPAHGVDAQIADAVEIGMRQALSKAGGEASGRRIRLVVLPATRPGDERWDPGTVEANAEQAVDDPTTIAYLGELDQGGSAVSLPVTNRKGILQVSPADGLTSLGRMLPGEAQDSSQRYYPGGSVTFARFVPPDIDAAREIADAVEGSGARKVVVLHGPGIANRELEELVTTGLGDRALETKRIALRDADPDHVRSVVEEVVAAAPGALLAFVSRGPESRAVLAALAPRIGDIPVIGGPSLSGGGDFSQAPARACAWTGIPDPTRLPPRGRELLAELNAVGGQALGSEAVLGFASMRLVLNAVARGGSDRREVVRAARASVDRDEVVVGHGLGDRAHAEGFSVECVPLRRR
jgi:branched-chain amino acid transport system substrate-binding protein